MGRGSKRIQFLIEEDLVLYLFQSLELNKTITLADVKMIDILSGFR